MVPGKIEKVLCLGNITDRETLHYLQGLSREFLGVKGEFDDPVIYQVKSAAAANSNGALEGSGAPNNSNNGAVPGAFRQEIGVGSLSGSTSIGGLAAAGSGVSPSPAYMSNAPDGATLNTYASVSGGGPYDASATSNNTSVRPAAAASKPVVESITLPLSRVVTLGQLRVGFNSGHTVVPNSDPDALLIAARQLDVDIFIWGGTHRVEAYQLEGKFFVNPGSATGAFYTGWPDVDEVEEEEKEDKEEEDKEEGEEKKEDSVEPKDPIPSFCLLDIQGTVCVVYIYRYVDGEVKVDKINYRRDE